MTLGKAIAEASEMAMIVQSRNKKGRTSVMSSTKADSTNENAVRTGNSSMVGKRDSDLPPSMTESDRMIYKPTAFMGNTIYIYEQQKLTPDELIQIIIDLVAEDVHAEKLAAR